MTPTCEGDTHRYRIPMFGTIPLVPQWSCYCGRSAMTWRPPDVVTFTWEASA